MASELDGQNEHPWLRDPETGSAWLYKPVVVHGEHRQGEDWVEKVASEIAHLMTLPAATVDLAQRHGRAGCVSLDLKRRGWEMHAGAVLLSGSVRDYESQTRNREGHNIANIRKVLTGLAAPPASDLPAEFQAFDVFVGYLVFDALIANRDRHDYNWSVLRPPPAEDGNDALCGSYDHASALAFSLRDDQRARRLKDHSVRAWADRGTAYKFEHTVGLPVPSLVKMAADALRLCSADVADYWLRAIASLERDALAEIVQSVPGLSPVTVDFTVSLLLINQERVLSGE